MNQRQKPRDTREQIPIKQCPYCGSEDLGSGWQQDQGLVTYKRSGLFGNPVRPYHLQKVRWYPIQPRCLMLIDIRQFRFSVKICSGRALCAALIIERLPVCLQAPRTHCESGGAVRV